MTNYEMKLLLQAGLGIEVSEERAAWILAGVEERLRNVAAQQSVQPTVGILTAQEVPAIKEGTGIEYLSRQPHSG